MAQVQHAPLVAPPPLGALALVPEAESPPPAPRRNRMGPRRHSIPKERAEQHLVDSYVEILEDKRADGVLQSYLCTVHSRLVASGADMHEVFLALERIGEDAEAWRSRLM